jgi:hypothetical protein
MGDMLASWWTYLDSLPELLKGTFLGSIFTLVGVWATNRANQKNLRAQLEHDRDMRAKQHALDLRKGIYLEVAEILAFGLRSIVELNHVNRSSLDIFEQYASRGAGLAKIHVIASEKTAIHLSSFVRDLEATFFELRLAHQAIDDLIEEIRINVDLRDQCHRSRDSLFAIFKQERLAGPLPEEKFRTLREDHQAEITNAQKYEHERQKLSARLAPLHLEFTKRCFLEHSRLSSTLLPLIVSVRQDLELPIQSETYAAVLQSDVDGALQRIERLFSQVNGASQETK